MQEIVLENRLLTGYLLLNAVHFSQTEIDSHLIIVITDRNCEFEWDIIWSVNKRHHNINISGGIVRQ